jgi:hypothetical protein
MIGIDELQSFEFPRTGELAFILHGPSSAMQRPQKANNHQDCQT